MKNYLKYIISYGALIVFAFAMTACGNKGLADLDAGSHYYYPSETETEEVFITEDQNLYLIMENDSIEEELFLYDYNQKRQYVYHYGLTTHFKDKYGNRSNSAEFTPGRAVWIGNVDTDGRLVEVGLSADVWEYTDIKRFETNPSEGMLTIADSDYRYNDMSFTFSGDEMVAFSSITEDDILSVVGIDKQILSVNVTTGHGTLELKNTELFEGSFLQLGQKIFAEITPDMTMDLQEGDYLLAVANDGWGGTKQITISKGETTVVDLDELKGEGPKYANIAFVISPSNSVLYVDGSQVDYSLPISLKYGKHAISVVSEGEDTWTRTLYVNSPEATIQITVSDSEDASSGSSDSTSNTTGTSTESQSSQSGGNTTSSQGTDSSTSTDYDDLYKYLTDYLSTLSSIVS